MITTDNGKTHCEGTGFELATNLSDIVETLYKHWTDIAIESGANETAAREIVRGLLNECFEAGMDQAGTHLVIQEEGEEDVGKGKMA